LLLVLQVVSALLLYRTLLPPPAPTGIDTLVVATAKANAALATTLTPRERLVALPEAPRIASAERVPDLATALRRHAGTSRLRVVGAGLPARDRDSALGLALAYEPSPLPRGLVELSVPTQTQAGADFHIQGRGENLRGGSVELLDPAGQRVDREPLDAEGRFQLLGAARTAGLAQFRLRLHHASGRLAEETVIPLHVVTTPLPRVLALAGGPDAELKFLRRWAIDSGIRMHAQIQLGGGMQAGDPAIAFNAVTLKSFDVVIVDERAWNSLGEGRRRILVDAVHDGLGLVLRVAGPMSAQGRRELAALGLRFAPASIPATFVLPSAEGSSDFAAARVGPGTSDAPTSDADLNAAMPVLTRQPLRLTTSDAQALLRDGAGQPVATWTPAGRGRIALWLPIDTYQLVLAGREDLHASLWSDAIAKVARARMAPAPGVAADARQGERIRICALGERAAIVAPDGKSTPLLIDPATGAARCAGYWPKAAGWHVLQTGDAQRPFFIRSHDDKPGITAQRLRDATQQLVRSSTTLPNPPATLPGSRWSWFFGWIALSAVMWWFERSRFGRQSRNGSATRSPDVR
jgi:hypothetical protein